MEAFQRQTQKYYTKFKCFNPEAINERAAVKKANLINSINDARIISKNNRNFDFLSEEEESLLIST